MNCRTCNHSLGEHAITDGTRRAPNAGDVSVCMYCGSLSIFRGDGSTTAPTFQEFDMMVCDPQIIEAMHVALLLRKQLGVSDN